MDSSRNDFRETVSEQIDADHRRKRIHLNEEQRIDMMKFFGTHSTKETAERLGCTERYVTNWNRRLMLIGNCKRKLRKDGSWKDRDLQEVKESLLVYNSPVRARNVLLPTYNEIAVAKAKSYSSLQRLAASRLLGTVNHKKSGKRQDSKEEHHHHNHQAKYPGEIVAIDRKDVPIGVYANYLHDEECAERIRKELIHQIIR